MEYNNVYVNGSSFSYGYGLDKKEFLQTLSKFNEEYPNYNLKQSELNKFRENNCWPGVLQNILNKKVVNESLYGGSFSRVMRMTFDYINSQENPRKTFYVLEVPNYDRYDLFSVQQNRFIKASSPEVSDEEVVGMEFNAIKQFYTCFSDWVVAWRREVMNLLFFSNYLKSLNLNFIIIPTEQFLLTQQLNQSSDKLSHWSNRIFNNSIQNSLKNIDLNIIKFPTKNNSYGNLYDNSKFTPYKNYTNNLLVYSDENENFMFNEETDNLLNDRHFTLNGNKQIAKQVFNYMEYYKSVTI
jgi:hypothetical protein